MSYSYFFKNMSMKLLMMTVLIFMVLISNAQTTKEPTKEVHKFPDSETSKNSGYSYTIISAANNTWCYDIYKDNKIFIHQPSIPAIMGNDGFKKKSDADKVAKLVINKIKKGEMPPSVTEKELRELRVL